MDISTDSDADHLNTATLKLARSATHSEIKSASVDRATPPSKLRHNIYVAVAVEHATAVR